jgi:hypothetical protein
MCRAIVRHIYLNLGKERGQAIGIVQFRASVNLPLFMESSFSRAWDHK